MRWLIILFALAVSAPATAQRVPLPPERPANMTREEPPATPVIAQPTQPAIVATPQPVQAPTPPAGNVALGGVALLAVAVLIPLLYFLPSVIAARRRHRNTGPIIVVNLLAGWTGLAWLAALVWSLTDNVRPRDTAQTTPAAPPMRGVTAGPIVEVREREDPYDDGLRRYPSAVVGLDHPDPAGHDRARSAARLKPGAIVDLVREPDNPVDPRAVAVVWGGARLGYIPQRHDWIARAIDEGTTLEAEVDRVVIEAGRAVEVGLMVAVVEKAAQPVRPIAVITSVAAEAAGRTSTAIRGAGDVIGGAAAAVGGAARTTAAGIAGAVGAAASTVGQGATTVVGAVAQRLDAASEAAEARERAAAAEREMKQRARERWRLIALIAALAALVAATASLIEPVTRLMR